jgi:sulfur carrier protein ThiS
MAAEALIWSGEMEAAMKLAGGNTVKGFGDGVDENESDATGAMESLSDSIQGTFTRALEIQSPSGIFKGYGKNIVQGLIDGINSMWTDLVSLAGSLADLFPEWMRDLLGIDSPSKVMFEIGKNTVAGFGFGFETGMAELVASMGGRVKTQMSELIDSFDPRNNGMVQAEDGSWVPKSFYASSNTPIRTPLSDLIDSFSPSVRGLIQAEDGSWVPKSFYAQPAPARNNTTIGDIYVTIAANGKVDEEAGRAAGRGIAEELRRRGFQ